MSARSLLISAAVSVGVLTPVFFTAPVLADEPAITDTVETAKNSFPGIVNANAVYIRCGPAESYYPTSKLDKGARVTVVGIKMDWLKIVPPDGSFCYIAKAYVEKRGDGTVGRVTKETVNVRAGSSLNNLKVVPLCQLTQGTDVAILGEQDEYFKIKPPEKAFLYVNKQFIEPDPQATPKPIEAIATAPAPDPVQPVQPREATRPETTTTGTTPEMPSRTTERPAPTVVDGNPGQPTTTGQPATGQPVTGEVGTIPATNPTQAAVPTTSPAELQAQAEQLFDKTETIFAASNGKPLEQQPIQDMLKNYQQLAQADLLVPTLRRVVDTRVATLKIRAEAADELVKARVAQKVMIDRQMALQAERKELEAQMQQTAVTSFTAVGTLQPSSLQLGKDTLYRLTDPANGRTVVYLRTNDGKFLTQLGKFIGVKGDLTTEHALSLKVIAPTDMSVVDPAKVNHGVSAQVIPPSMLQMEASTDQR